MRETVHKRLSAVRTNISHVGLGYTTLAPVETERDAGDDADARRAAWLASLAEVPPSADYVAYVDAWLRSFADASARVFALTFSTRLLIGHGNASGFGVGLTLHHTWGTPIVPGSALKGLVTHHLANTYDLDAPPPDAARGHDARWISRALFGSADDPALDGHGATRGLVTFHDAIFRGIAGGDHARSSPDVRPPPFAADVLTVHQRSYYNTSGAEEPSDHDSPNPVGFLSVRPRAQFTVVLEGPPEWTQLAGRLLADALGATGVGGKSAAGYGRGVLVEDRLPPPPPSALVVEVQAWFESTAGQQREKLTAFEQRWMSPLLAAPARDRLAVAVLLENEINSRKLVGIRDALTATLRKT